MPGFRLRYRTILIVLLVLLGLLANLWLAGRYAQQSALEARSVEARGQLQLYAQTLHTLVERFRSVPALLALDGQIQALLNAPNDVVLRDTLNRRLEQLNAAAGSNVLYLLDHRGQTLVASNWREPTSFVGNNYAFRPYFQDGLTQAGGRYFAIGVTTTIPGYFLSHGVLDENGKALGVLVVKLELEDLQREWVEQPQVLLVTDRQGIVIMSNRPAWRFRALEPLPEQNRTRLLSARQYADQALLPIPSQLLQRVNPAAERRRVEGPDGRQDYLWQRLDVPNEGWTLHLLMAPKALNSNLLSYRLAAVGVWLALIFLSLFLVQRRKNQRLQMGIRERLERQVTLRTAELREAQEDLVQAAKMAALGQMSAALAHEINQPLTALQMQLASLRLLLDRGRPSDARAGLPRIDALLQRLAKLTGHLKTFARKSPAGLRERLCLSEVLEQALQLLAPRLRSEQVQLHNQLSPLNQQPHLHEKDGPARVLGDAIRLEQVLLNLLNNALDAMAGRAQRVLTIVLERDGPDWRLSLEDSGGGIASEHLARVFEPFFTTKPVGEGLGLGLAVSYGIARELGGSLEAANTADGARFTLRLPAAPDAQ